MGILGNRLNTTAKDILGMHGELNNPKAVLGNDLGVSIDLLAAATDVVTVGTLDGPASVLLRLDFEGLVGALALGVTVECTGSGGGEVAVEGSADEDLGVSCLEGEDLLLLEGGSVGIDAEAKGLGGQVLASRVAEPEGPGESVDTSGRHTVRE